MTIEKTSRNTPDRTDFPFGPAKANLTASPQSKFQC
jgi:hypothetical protein